MQRIATTHGITLASELTRLDVDAAAYRRAAAKGAMVRVHRGAYVDASEWQAMDRHERYRRRVLAAILASRGCPPASHQSAAALLGIPIIGQWPSLVHVLCSRASGTRTENGFRRHASDFDLEIVRLDGIPVVGVTDTLVDLAASSTFASAVAGVDHCLRNGLTDADRLRAAAARYPRCSRRVNRVLDFATPLSGSPGESLSRVAIHELGFPAPELQVAFADSRGHVADVDFWWRDYNRVGEFDGLVKYTRDQFKKGRSIDEVVIAEKVREDRLRALGPAVSRWLWNDALHARELYTLLSDAGLPTRSRHK